MRILLLCLTLLIGSVQAAEPLTIAAGAGYKKPMMKLYQAFKANSGIEVTPIFGNMRAVITQTKESGHVDLAVGDQSFLSATPLFERFVILGKGKLVLAWADKPPTQGYQALLSQKYKRIAQPDPMKAVYGKAATQFLQRSGLAGKIADRLVITATVPQVSSYLAAKSIDAGFINLTDALALQDTIGGYTMLPEDLYDPITIVAGVVKQHGNEASIKAFIDFLATPQAKQIINEAGL